MAEERLLFADERRGDVLAADNLVLGVLEGSLVLLPILPGEHVAPLLRQELGRDPGILIGAKFDPLPAVAARLPHPPEVPTLAPRGTELDQSAVAYGKHRGNRREDAVVDPASLVGNY